MATTKKKQSDYDRWANTKAGSMINSINNKPYDSGGRQQPTYTNPSNKYNGDLIYSGAGKIGGGSTIPYVSYVVGPNSGSSMANNVNRFFDGVNNAGRNVTSGASKIVDTIIKNAAGGLAAGKSPYDVADSIQGGGASYTPPSTSTSTKSTQTVTMPTSVGDLPTYNSEYMDQLNALARQLTSMNYDDWTKGSQYQALAERYGASGRMSMQDVLGQVASRTGGLASSYATTAAQQQYNQYMAQLEEVARQLYSQERGDLMDSASLYRNLANDEYDRYRDSLSDYNARLKAAQSAAQQAYQNSTWEDRGSTPESRTSLAGFSSNATRYSTGNLTGLDYSPDEGVFTWNGKSYGSMSRLLQDIESAGLSNDEKNKLRKKFANYGYDISF